MDSPPFLLLCGNNTPAAGAAAAAGAATELLKEAAAAKEIKIKSLSSFLQEDVSSVIQQKVFFVSLDTKEAKEQQFAAAAAVLLQHLQTNGLLILAVEGAAAAEVLAAANRSCMYSGFLELRREEWPQNILKAAEKRNNVSIGVWKKPPWAVGASAPIGASAAAATGAAAGGETGLIDENSLIDPKETYTPLGKGRSDCASRPRACANCTCGRKELEEKADKEAFKKLLETGAVRSSCGNCYLGDAFRCAGCPYRGLPAFRPGEKVDLSAEGRAGAAAAVTAAAAAAAAPGDAAAAGITVDKTTNKVVLSSLDDDL